VTRYYSENGEDFLLDQLFKNQAEGFFVEVGCIDGRRHSNTLTFEERGWRGMCIEAHSDYIAMLRAHRPNSIICACAAGEADEDAAIFYANRWGSLSSLDRSREQEFKQRFGPRFAGFEMQTVKKRRLDTLFQEYGVTTIDILSIDIEGYEAEALKGIDFGRFRPEVIIVESENRSHRDQIDAILLPNGYVRSVRLAQNIFYLCNRALEHRIRGKVFSVTLNRTRHPLDAGADVLLLSRQIDTRRVTAFRQSILNKLNAIAARFTKLLSPKRLTQQ
jgi:FkbM family methyltransferase